MPLLAPGVGMLSRSAGHAHSWRAGVGMRALCPFLGAGAGHVRWAWSWALDMSGGLGAGRWTCPRAWGEAGHVRWSGRGARWVVGMLSRSAGHAHSWRAGVGIRALCPFLGAGAGHVRWAWGWARDMSAGRGAGRGTCPAGPGGGHGRPVRGACSLWRAGAGTGHASGPRHGRGAVRGLGWAVRSAPGQQRPRRSAASRGPAGSARTAAAFPPCPRQRGRSGPSGSPGPPAACAREDWARRPPQKWSRCRGR